MGLFANIGRARETCRITRVQEYETDGGKVVLPARDYRACEVLLPEDCCRLRGEVDVREKGAAQCRFRVVNVLCLARQKGHRRLVLGAWGCGAFGHRAENVAEYFRHVLIEEERHTWFDDVCFAIYGPPKGRNLFAFQTVFQNS